jgi:hypothetical protein
MMQGFLKRAAVFGMLVSLSAPHAVWAASSAIQAQKPWVKAVPESSENSVAYLVLKNPSDKPVKLIEASSPASRVVEIHQHLHENGMMKMIKVDSVELPAHGEVEFKPMGLHLMLIGLKPGFQKKTSVDLRLTFSDHSHISVKAPVRGPDSEE